ncbi:hypothetical protein L1987_08383 [Smallanthus sonchifolius]|uniref:Uncharacterized protein n=1 Tax=Smallanthus sonchifolius TaxID=185202 RepID=A0ACB9JKY0_9ASTR|nr:hypothetical protein L1987_08383 [Smallanthus sonchifolius]
MQASPSHDSPMLPSTPCSVCDDLHASMPPPVAHYDHLEVPSPTHEPAAQSHEPDMRQPTSAASPTRSDVSHGRAPLLSATSEEAAASHGPVDVSYGRAPLLSAASSQQPLQPP